MAKSDLETILFQHIQLTGLPEPEREYRFDPTRRWRFDFAYPDIRLAIECEGGTWSGGRHTRGSGFERDCEKYNKASLLGWRVLRFTSGMISDGSAINQIQDYFKRGNV